MQDKKHISVVAGGAGFIGSNLCRRLLHDGRHVVCIDNLSTGCFDNVQSMVGDDFEFIRHDITEPLPIGIHADEIYNLACPASPVHYQRNPIATTKAAVIGTLNMLELAKASKCPILQSSTSEVYGNPNVHPQTEDYNGNVNPVGVRSCYDEGKRCAETLAADYRRAHGVDVRLVRIFNTYGPNMHPEDGRVISNFILQALRNEDITIYGDGSQTRSFQYCDDLVEAMRRYMELPREEVDAFFAAKKLGAPVINTGNPGEYTVRQLAEETLKLIPESKSKLVSRPLPADDPRRRRPDISLAKELLGWEPKVPLAEGLAKTIDYFRAREKSVACR